MKVGTNRRSFLKSGALYLAGIGASTVSAGSEEKSLLKLGLLTDIHYGEKDTVGNRYYRESLQKFTTAIQHFNESKMDAVIELGDLIDQAENRDTEAQWLNTIDHAYGKLTCPRHYVLGNHCLANFSKFEFASLTKACERSFYHFENNGVHVLVLDGCFKSDETAYQRGNFDWKDSYIPSLEKKWLKHQLEVLSGPIIVFMHQRCDDSGVYSVKNAAEIRQILEASGKVCAVFQGHSHKNAYQEISGIHYVTLAGLIEGSGAEANSFAELHVLPNGLLKVIGFHTQKSYDLVRG